MTLTLCLRPTAGEPCVSLAFPLTERRTVVAIAARHLVTDVGVDPGDGHTPTVWVEAASERARPVDVRFEVVAAGERAPTGARLLGSVPDGGGAVRVYGTYLGPVSDEN